MIRKTLIASTLACLVLLPSCRQQPKSLEDVRAEVRQEYIQSSSIGMADEVQQTQEADGSWKDIDYKDRSRATWKPATHLNRLTAMAASYVKNGQDPVMLESILKGLKFWFDAKCKSDNWWHNDIGGPQILLNIVWLLDDKLPEDLKVPVFETLKKIDSDAGPGRPGGDRSKVIGDNAKAALFMRNWEDAIEQFHNLEKEAHIANPEEISRDLNSPVTRRNINPTTGRGLQPDMSYHHRNEGVDNTNSYGSAIVSQFAYWGEKLIGTGYDLNQREIECVIDYFIEGSMKHTVKDMWQEPGSWNRDLARQSGEQGEGRRFHSKAYATGLKKICNGYREAELDEIIAVCNGEKPFDKTYATFFWCSQYFIYQNPQYAASVRMHSNLTANIEYPYNGEAIHSHFRGDGASHLSMNGGEYNGMQGVFDFKMIPGTTSLIIDEFPKEPQKIGKSVFVGGVVDGKVGSAAFDFISPFYDLKARKGWFFFDKGYVCLGAGINSSEKFPVVTTLEQCGSAGDSKADGTLAVYNNKVLYQSLDGKTLNYIDEELYGDYTNVVKGTTYDNQKDTASVFKLWIEHGTKPKDASYAYAVIPFADKTKAADLFNVLSNTKSLQAVESKDGKTAMFIFYEAGKAQCALGEVEVESPCMLLLSGGKAYVSDPSRSLDRIYITLDGKRRITPLPVWQHSGETVPVWEAGQKY